MKKKITLKYPALFEVNSDGISISFPDIPGCLSCAFSKSQAFKMAKEALALALHGAKIHELPTQSYPVRRFTSKTFYIRTIVIKIEFKDNYLFDKDVVVFSKAQEDSPNDITEKTSSNAEMNVEENK